MSATSSSQQEHLDRLVSPSGQFAILALDHVASFTPTDVGTMQSELSEEGRNRAKREIVQQVGPHATAVLIDPSYLVSGKLDEIGLGDGSRTILGIEDGDYLDAPVNPRLLPGWTVDRAAVTGVAALKISFYFEPGSTNPSVNSFVRETIAQCRSVGLPLFCEPLAVLKDPVQTREQVVEGVRIFGAMEPDILKIQFPEQSTGFSIDRWDEACAAVDAASPVPWTLLSNGQHFTAFAAMLRSACQAGASGFLGGRTVWRQSQRDSNESLDGAQRLTELRAIAEEFGTSWRRTRQPLDTQEDKR